MSQQDTQAKFEPTHWSIVLQAADTSDPAAHDALSEFCALCMRSFAVREWIVTRQKDLTQGFFLHLLERNLIKQVDRERGRFRSFLPACLTNFMKDEWRKEKADKRGGRMAAVVSIDEEDAEEKYGRLPGQEAHPNGQMSSGRARGAL